MSCPDRDDWPPRPPNEIFPELLDTLLVAQLILYDRRGMNTEQARRNVRTLVKDGGLPTLGRIGTTLMYRRTDVIEWLANRGAVDGTQDGSTIDVA